MTNLKQQNNKVNGKNNLEGGLTMVSKESRDNQENYMYTINQAAKYFNIGAHTLRKMVKQNQNAMYIFRVGNRVLIKKNLFIEFLNTNTSAF